jgi:hypothetical protein
MSNSVPASYSDRSGKLTTTAHDGDFLPGNRDISNDEHCLEMVYQVLLHNDQLAKEKVQRQLSEAVLGWLRFHPRREEARKYGNEEYYLAHAFECFWQAIVLDKEVELSTLSAVLKYLQASLDGVIIETLRNYSYSRELSIAESMETVETVEPGYPWRPFLAGHDNSSEIWKNIQSFLSNTREQHLAYLLFHCSLKPKEIIQSYPLEYSDLQEILHLRCKVMTGLTTAPSSLSFRLAAE